MSAPTSDRRSEPRSATLVPRAALRRRLDQLGADASAGVIHFDLRRFREVNQRWGHGVGDNVLAITQRRLLQSAPRRALISDAGPTFTMVLPDADTATTRAAAEQLAATIRTPIRIGAVHVTLGVNTGFAWAGPGSADVSLLEHAMLAFRSAKDLGNDQPAEYVDALSRDASRERRMEAELLAAISAGDLRAYFQPVVDLRDGTVVGLEALVRWPHAQDGLLLPEDFLGVAESAGLMPDVGQWMLDRVLDVLSQLRADSRDDPLRVWVNLSANELSGADDVLRRISIAIEEGTISPREIGFEVTESTLLSDLDSAVDSLSSLRRLGVEIALDDFGTGYSSLSYLRRLPVTAVKIDRSFVAGLGRSLADEAIVEAVIDLAHAFGLRVIAEGVEDAVQADALIALGADEAQGFLFGTPAPIDQLGDVIDRLWGGALAPQAAGQRSIDRRADALPGFGSPRARLLLAALDSAHDAIVVTAGAGDGIATRLIIYANAAFEADTGFAARTLVGRPMDELFSQPSDHELAAWYEGVYAAARSASREVVWRRADGSSYVCEMTVSPIFDEREVLTHWLHTGRDITQRHVLQAERARFQWMIEQSESLVFMFEQGGAWVYANAAMRAAIGLAPDAPLDGVSNTSVGLVGGAAGAAGSLLEEDVQRLRSTGSWSGPSSFVNPTTGAVTEVLCDIQRLTDPLEQGGRLYVAVSRDVTEVNALERAELRRRDLVAVVTQLAHRGVEAGVEEVLAGLHTVIARFGEQLDCDVVSVDVIDEVDDVVRTADLWQRGEDGTATAAGTAAPAVPAGELRHWLDLVDSERVVVDPDSGHGGERWESELAMLFPTRPRDSCLFARLKVGGELLGVFGVACRSADREWTVDEIDAVDQFANVLANLLHRKRSVLALRADMAAASQRAAFERVQIGVAEWALALDAVQFLGGVETHLEHLATVLGADTVSLSTLEDGELRRTARWPTPSTSPIGGTPRLNHPKLLAKLPDLEPLIVTDIETCDEPWADEWRTDRDAPRSAMIVPLGTAGRWYGAITVAMEHTTRHWDDAEIALVRGITGMIASVVARRRVEASLRAGESRLQAMLDGSPDLILVVDDFGITRFANLTVRKLLETTNEELVGTPVLKMVHPEDRLLAEQRMRDLLAGRPTLATRVRAIRPDGAESWWEITSGVQRNTLVGGTILTCRDVTSHVAVERADATRVERLRYAFELAQLALDLGPDAFLAQLDESCTQIAGMLDADQVWVEQVDENRGVMTTIGRVGFDDGADGPLPFAAVPNWLRRLRDPEPVRIPSIADAVQPWAVERRQVSDLAGGVVALAMSAAGELVGELGVAMHSSPRDWDDDEVTFLRIVAETIAHVLERARLDAALRASEARFRILSETAADVVILIDDRGIIAYVSPSSHALLGYTPAQLIGQPAATLLPGGRGDLIRLVDDRENRHASGPAEVELRRADGELIWVAHSTSAVLDSRSNSRVTYRISVRDITERKRLETELSWQALHDPLTGLGNRVLLQRRLDEAVRSTTGKGLAVLLIDLDRFKEVNDTLGHAHGDEVLRIVSARLSSLTRPSDTLARTGGDEFVVICPETEPYDAISVGERIVRTLMEPVVTGGASVTVGASIGIAHAGNGSVTADSDRLLIDADRAMYAAKDAGGSTVRLA